MTAEKRATQTDEDTETTPAAFLERVWIEYHVKYYVRNIADAKKKLVRNCKHWPLIREIKQPSGEFGDTIVLRPSKVDETLTKKLYT